MRSLLVVAVLSTALAGAGVALQEPAQTLALALAYQASEHGDPDRALVWLDRAERIGADPAAAAGLRGTALVQRGDSAAALAAFDAAARSPGVTSGALTARADLVLDLGADTTGLARQLDRAVRGCVAPDPYLARARYHTLAGRADRALADLDAALERAPDWGLVRIRRARVLEALGRDAEARAAFVALAEDFPDVAEVQIDLARFHAVRGEWAALVGPAEALVRIDPSRLDDRLAAATVHACVGNAEGARRHLDAFVAGGGDPATVDEAVRAAAGGADRTGSALCRPPARP